MTNDNSFKARDSSYLLVLENQQFCRGNKFKRAFQIR